MGKGKVNDKSAGVGGRWWFGGGGDRVSAEIAVSAEFPSARLSTIQISICESVHMSEWKTSSTRNCLRPEIPLINTDALN